MSEDQKQRWRGIVASAVVSSTNDAAERVKNQLAMAQEALKALLIANGGAMVALFTFIGNVLAKAPATKFDAHILRWAFGLFVAGFVADLIAYVLGFLSQDRFYKQAIAEVERLSRSILADEPDRDQTKEAQLLARGQVFYLAGIAMAVLSVACFAVGCGFALSGALL